MSLGVGSWCFRVLRSDGMPGLLKIRRVYMADSGLDTWEHSKRLQKAFWFFQRLAEGFPKGSMPTLGPKYIPYSYMEPLGFGQDLGPRLHGFVGS